MSLMEFLSLVGTLPHMNVLSIGADWLEVIEVPAVVIRRVRIALRLSSVPAECFDRHATVFEALAVRCARYAHFNLPPDILQAFFHKNVTYPFLRFRMLRHLYIWSPVDWQEISDVTVSPCVKGIWIRKDATKDPDIVLYYIHGESAPCRQRAAPSRCLANCRNRGWFCDGLYPLLS